MVVISAVIFLLAFAFQNHRVAMGLARINETQNEVLATANDFAGDVLFVTHFVTFKKVSLIEFKKICCFRLNGC